MQIEPFESIQSIRMQILTIWTKFEAFECTFEPFERDSNAFKSKFEPLERDSKHSNANSNHSKEIRN